MLFAVKVRWFVKEDLKSVTESMLITAKTYSEAVKIVEDMYTDPMAEKYPTYPAIEQLTIVPLFEEDGIYDISNETFDTIEEHNA